MNCKVFRSVFNAFYVQQQRSLSNIKYPVKVWSDKETDLLLQLVEIHGTNWATIQSHFKDRGSKSIASRYRLVLKRGVDSLRRSAILKSSRKWTPEEDTELLKLVEENGTQWSKLAPQFYKRNEEALSRRYERLLGKSDYRKGGWTKEETAQFQSLFVIYGEDFNLISNILKTRTEEQCRAKYKYLSSLPTSISKLSNEQIQDLRKAVEIYGLNDFKLILQKANLPFGLQPDDVRTYYIRELDPKIVVGEWTKEEVKFMVQVFNELEGCMELVQSRLPIKRGLQDMWVHYYKYIQDNKNLL